MPVPPPPDWGDLWSAVRPLVAWPITDEDRVRDGLARNWTNAGAGFMYASASRSSDYVTTGWSDQVGQDYQAKVLALRGTAATAGTEMHKLGRLATAFADDVAHTKTSISDLIKKHAWAYSHMRNFFGWPDVEGQKRFATQLAASINDFIDVMAARIAARGAGAPESPLPIFADTASGTAAEALLPPDVPGGERRVPVTKERYEALGRDPATGQFRPNEADTALRIEDLRSVTLTRSPSAQGPDWIDDAGKTYDAIGPVPQRFFDQQWSNVQRQIAGHLGKADYVPVDVTGLSPTQLAQVRAYVDRLGPRVFLVGE